ncbi:ATP-grasp domain-containing protein [Nocardia crassostreae]|uniref:ATP-grasp domain-containing protein n=1 Tax=Nocardia crassostreae TaxID=53428 RepID=UPI00083604E8|nr:ATP-grasp domain-containing protein [Nocardia crassostreae]
MTRTLVILGGADGSLPTYRRARELGYRTICVDRRPDALARPFADEFVRLSIHDPGPIAHVLDGRADIAGVLSPASDTGLPAQRALIRRWRLPEPPAAAVVRASGAKSYFRAVCDRLGFARHGYVAGAADAELSIRAAALRFPVLVKPLDAQSSRGIRACTDPSQVAAAANRAGGHASDGRVIVEELLTGKHYSAEAFVDDGRIAFVGVSARTLTPPPHFVTTAHRVPADLDPAALRELTHLLDTLVAELGYRRGPLTVDLLIDPAGRIHLIEMGARVGGNGLGELIRHAYGVDLIGASIAAATGRAAQVTRTCARAAVAQILFSERAGTITRVLGADTAITTPELVELTVFARPGHPALPYDNAANKLGHFVIAADSPRQAAAAAERVGNLLRIELSGAA